MIHFHNVHIPLPHYSSTCRGIKTNFLSCSFVTPAVQGTFTRAIASTLHPSSDSNRLRFPPLVSSYHHMKWDHTTLSTRYNSNPVKKQVMRSLFFPSPTDYLPRKIAILTVSSVCRRFGRSERAQTHHSLLTNFGGIFKHLRVERSIFTSDEKEWLSKQHH